MSEVSDSLEDDVFLETQIGMHQLGLWNQETCLF